MKRTGDAAWNRVPKVNAELFTLTYGALVLQVILIIFFFTQTNKNYYNIVDKRL